MGLFLTGFSFYKLVKANYFNPLKSDNHRVNLLLLGINGSGGADKDLTDTIIFVSLDKQTNKVVFLSIPRDLWIEEIKAKINTAYHYGGISLAKSTVENLLGQPIDYYALVNFDSFEKIIDYLGGIEVKVENSFDDYKYPIPGKEKDLCDGDKELKCRYEHLHFDAGMQTMDGATALKFARSRNAQGEEGTDFARSARQQKIILGIKDKIIKDKFSFTSKKALGLVSLVQNEVVTDIKPEVYGSLGLLLVNLNHQKAMPNLTVLNDNLLVHPQTHYSKQWVMVPQEPTGKDIKEFVNQLLN